MEDVEATTHVFANFNSAFAPEQLCRMEVNFANEVSIFPG